jgi:phospholipid/cholesterol/gamma-HCH transport system substrate-binding protein
MVKSYLRLSNLKVGLTVFIGLVIFFIFIFLVGSQESIFRSTYNLRMFVTNAEGLSNGALVSLGGLKIGDVSDIRFMNKDGKNGILIVLNIQQKYQSQITNNSIAKISTMGLLGDKFVDISLGQPGEVILKDNAFISVKESQNIESITSKLQPALDDFSGVVRNLKNITDSISEGQGSIGRLINNKKTANNLESIITNLKSFTTALTAQEGTLGKLAYDNSLFDNLSSLAGNLKGITDTIKAGKGTLGKLIASDSLYLSTNSFAKRLNKLLSKTDSDSTVVGGLFNDKKLYLKLDSLLVDLNRLIIDMKENPGKYVSFSVF